jgi:ferredoxin
MRLGVDETRCTGHGRCYSLSARDWLEPDDEGYVSIRGHDVEVPTGAEDSARDAAAACPETAIHIIDG